MAFLVDTDVMVHLRDGDRWTSRAVRELDLPLFISAITRVELENGAWREPEFVQKRQALLQIILEEVVVLDFGAQQIAAYGDILAVTGFSRRKVADRMTAATALVAGLSLVTFNGKDFRDVPALKLVEWTRSE